MFKNPPHSLRLSLCVLLAPLVLAVASPAVADEPIAPAVVEAPEVSFDATAIEELERKLDKELTADVERMLDNVVEYRSAGQQRWVAQHFFDATAPPGPAPADVSLVSRSARRR